MKVRTAEAAVGKWVGILSHFGLADNFLENRHGPCPLCGGKDRYRFDDREGRGTYYCSQCGSGDGMDLAIRFTGRDFKTITAEIDKIVGNIEQQQARKPSNSAERLRKILKESIDAPEDGAVRRYLRARNLPASIVLREHAALSYFDKGEKVSEHPAMIALMCDQHGAIAGMHITYLALDGKKAPVESPKKMLKAGDKMPPCVVKLTRPYEVIGVAEGIETALAVMKIYKVPCWAATSAGMMEKFIVSDGIQEVKIFGDNDASFTGQTSAFKLASRLHQSGIICSVILPDKIGDFADIVNG